MKWRFGGECRLTHWARGAKWRHWRIFGERGAYYVPGITKPAGWGRRERTQYGTIYGAKMAAEAAERKRRGA